MRTIRVTRASIPSLILYIEQSSTNEVRKVKDWIELSNEISLVHKLSGNVNVFFHGYLRIYVYMKWFKDYFYQFLDPPM